MVRSVRIGFLVAFLAITTPGWGQVLQPERYVMVKENGKNAVKCKVIKCWKEKDGSRVCQVQVVDSGEMMTIVEPGDASTTVGKTGSAESKPRVFAWGKGKTIPPPGVPTGPVTPQLVKSDTPIGRRLTPTSAAPSPQVVTASAKSSPPTTQTKASMPTPAPHTTTTPEPSGLLTKLFGTNSAPEKPTITKSVPTPPVSKAPQPVVRTTVEPAQPTKDVRQSWGKVERWTAQDTRTLTKSSPPTSVSTSRPALPVASKTGGDPLEKADVFTGVALPSSPTVVKNTTDKSAPDTKLAPTPIQPVTLPPSASTLPTLPASVSSTSNTMPLPPVGQHDKVVSTVVTTSKGDCKVCAEKGATSSTKVSSTKQECTVCKEKSTPRLVSRPQMSRQTKGADERPNLMTRLFGAEKSRETLVMTADGQTLVVNESQLKPVDKQNTHRPQLLTSRSSTEQPVTTRSAQVRKIPPLKSAPSKEESLTKREPILPPNEGRVGPFAGMAGTPGAPRVKDEKPPVRMDLPAGMGSVAAAAAPGVMGQTPVGALVRTPEGQIMVVPYSQVGPQTPSVPVAATNAFSLAASGQAMMANPDLAPNGFSMAQPARPIPADMGAAYHGPNAFIMEGMGGASHRPPMGMAMAGAYMPPMGYYPMPGGYYPVPMATYPAPMVAPAMASMPVGVAMASDQSMGTNQCLLTLRQSILPSERERAAEMLARSNWKADPQIVPALVMAAQSDPAPMVRVCCVRALGHMKANTMPVVEAVKGLKTDKDARVRQEVEKVLPVLMKH